jgi:P4 family phage/plasmid primase-like protien
MNQKKRCFTDSTEQFCVSWGKINISTFKQNISKYLKVEHNGFAILTGEKYFVLDIDNKHTPPKEIYDILEKNCEAIEQTPGGFHYWFLTDARTSHFTSTTDVFWKNQKINGLDIRAKGGICYTSPSNYITDDGQHKKYKWIKGNLSTVSAMSSELLEYLHYIKTQDDEVFSFTITKEKELSVDETDECEIGTILNSLKQDRVDTYSDWINVGMALKNSGYSCELWDEWSRSSCKYKPGECYKKWNTFKEKENGISKGSLYHWLKEDNYEVFIQLQGNDKGLHDKLLSCTNASIAEAFYELNPNRYAFSIVNGWYSLQSNNTWLAVGSKDILSIPDILNIIRTECYDVLNSILERYNRDREKDQAIYKLIGDAIIKLSNTSFIKGVTAFLQGLYYKKDVEKLFNANRDIFAFNNLILDMSTFEFREINPTDYITVTCGYDYREPSTGEKNIVRDFLNKIFPNEDVLSYVLKALSTTFEGYNRSEFFHVFTGLGANGKSCLIDLCKVVFGDYFGTLSVSYLTKDDDGKKDKPLPELANANYLRMLVSSEPEERDKFQVALLKLLTGGDEVSFRGMYSQVVNKYVPQFKLWILANDIPKLSKYDQGIERRMRCVHFPTRFVSTPRSENECLKDETIKEKIMKDETWKFGLLGLLLDAAKELKGKRLDMPSNVSEFTDKYLLENNPVGAWLKKYYEMTGNRKDIIQKTKLYNSFLQDTGLIKTQKSFSEDIVKCNISERKTDGIVYYYGIIRKEVIETDE